MDTQAVEAMIQKKEEEITVLKGLLQVTDGSREKPFPSEQDIWNARQAYIDELKASGAQLKGINRDTFLRPAWETCAMFFQEWFEGNKGIKRFPVRKK